MRRCDLFFVLVCLCWANDATADVLLATRTIRANTVLVSSDLVVGTDTIPGSLEQPHQALGLETRTTLYAGRPIQAADLGPITIINRNQIVELIYDAGALRIVAEGRSLDRAGIGDSVRAMNLDSRKTITGSVLANGSVLVGQ